MTYPPPHSVLSEVHELIRRAEPQDFGAKAVQPSTVDENPWDVELDWSYVDLGAEMRVARGMRYVQATYPDALNHITIGLLDIRDCKRCVLGQLFGDYIKAPEFRGRSVAWSIAHGFTPQHDGSYSIDADTFTLNEAWQRAFRVWAGQ